MDPICTYCDQPAAAHLPSDCAGWVACPPPHERLVFRDGPHFAPPPLAVCPRCGGKVPAPVEGAAT